MPDYYREASPRTPRPGYTRRVNYYAVSDGTSTDPDDAGEHPYGEITVSQTPRKYIVPYREKEESDPYTGLSYDYLHHVQSSISKKEEGQEITGRDEGVRTAAQTLLGWGDLDTDDLDGLDEYKKYSARRLQRNPEGNPDKLFIDISPQIKITHAFFDRRMRHTFPTTVAIAQQDLPGSEITASDDLSQYSTKVTHNAAKKGLINADPNNIQQTNNRGFTYKTLPTSDLTQLIPDAEKISNAEVHTARQALRENLRQTRVARGVSSKETPKLSSQFDQPTLFDS